MKYTKFNFIAIVIIIQIFSGYIPHTSCMESSAFSEVIKHFNNLPTEVIAYFDKLPKIKHPINKSSEEITNSVVDFLLIMGGYAANIDGIGLLKDKVQKAIEAKKPIQRCIPAFPVSSQNPNKIPFDDEHAFGLGDLVALLTRCYISTQIAEIYEPGSILSIYWEPYIYEANKKLKEYSAEISLYSDQRIHNYQNALRHMIKLAAPYVQIGEIPAGSIDTIYQQKYAQIPIKEDTTKRTYYKTFFKEDLNYKTVIQLLEKKQFEQKKSSIEKKHKSIQNKSFEEITQMSVYRKIQSVLSAKQKLTECADAVGDVVLAGSQRMALLMEQEIPNYSDIIRESIRPDTQTIARKIGSSMIYGAVGTPWQNILLIDKDLELVHYKTLLNKQGKLSEDYTIIYFSIENYKLPYVKYNN